MARRPPPSIAPWRDLPLPHRPLTRLVQMGSATRTVSGVWVYRVDAERGLLFVRGQVPGHNGNWVSVRDDARRQRQGAAPMKGLPFPTHLGPASVETAATDRPLRPGQPLSL